eukprot:gene7532-9256_t
MNFPARQKQRQIRKKIISNDDDEEVQETKTIISTSIIEDQLKESTLQPPLKGNKQKQPQQQQKKKSTTTNKTLSFEDDNEDTLFTPTITQPISSSSLKRNVDIDNNVSTATFNRNHSVGLYTKEKLKELKDSTTSRSGITTNNQSNTTTTATTTTTTTNTTSKSTDIISDDIKFTSEEQQELPTLEQIKSAKEKRKRIRDGKWQSDEKENDSFIPLSGGNTTSSRLVREEEDDEDEEQDTKNKGNKIAFGDPGRKSKSDSMVVEEPEEEEEDEEILRWQLDQIRKGGGIKDGSSMADEQKKRQQQQSLLLEAPIETSYYKSSNSAMESSRLLSSGSTFIESLNKDLNNIMISLREVEFSHKSELEKVEKALEDATETVSTLEAESLVNEQEYEHYLEYRSYVNNMVDCLGEKIPEIEDLEDRISELDKDHAFNLRRQIKNEIQDEIDEIDQEVVNKNSDQQEEESNLDEFGRDRTYYERSSRKSRLTISRRRRKEKREKRQQQQQEEEEGLSSDDEQLYDEDEENYHTQEKQKVLDSIDQVLIDVDPDYCEISNIKSRFEHWKGKDYKSYKKTHMGFIMPAIFAPFIRLQLIDWNPLSSKNFDQFNWYDELSNYGILKIKLDKDDPDINLIPKSSSLNIIQHQQQQLLQQTPQQRMIESVCPSPPRKKSKRQDRRIRLNLPTAKLFSKDPDYLCD